MGDGLAGILENNTLKRVIIWVVFGGFLYLCKPFYGVIIGTFVMSFVGNSVVNTLESQATAIRNFVIKKHNFHLPPVSRKVIAFFYIIIVLNVLIAFTVVTVPQVVESWRYLKQVRSPFSLPFDSPRSCLQFDSCSELAPSPTRCPTPLLILDPLHTKFHQQIFSLRALTRTPSCKPRRSCCRTTHTWSSRLPSAAS